MKVLVSIYIHPEFYPPTLNAILNFAEAADEVFIITRNVFKGDFPFPKNVKIITSGSYLSIKESEGKNFLWKFFSFLRFTVKKFYLINKIKPDIVVAYDPVPLLSLLTIKPFLLHKFKSWYHNHDIFEIERFRKYTIGWFAAKYEASALMNMDIFSLPANERKDHYKLTGEKFKYFFLPNYPSLNFYGKFYQTRHLNDEIILIYQGSIAEGHGLEMIISILNEKIEGKSLKLFLKGPVSADYKSLLIKHALQSNTNSRVVFHNVTSYRHVPELASGAHIGIAIHTGSDVMNKTLGTASNKIYEYAALGLPVLLYDNEHFRQHLDKYSWAFFTDCTKDSLSAVIAQIIKNYTPLSAAARKDFETILNFEKHFQPILSYLKVKKNKSFQKLDIGQNRIYSSL